MYGWADGHLYETRFIAVLHVSNQSVIGVVGRAEVIGNIYIKSM